MRHATLLLALVVGCAEPLPVVAPSAAPMTPPQAAPVSPWRESTETPQAVSPPAEPRAAELAAACGTLDGALLAVAERIVREGGEADVDRVTALLRERGSPIVRPRIVSGASIRPALELMHSSSNRCGVAVAASGELAIVAQAIADLEPLPVRARTGAWLEVRAFVRVPARGARVVVLGSRGVPRTVATSFESGRVRARFALDRPGAFTVQVVAELEDGPRPVLEARVFADATPASTEEAAPGEEIGGEDDAALERMVGAVRAVESLRALKRDPRLDALARAHVERLKKAGAVVHDLGDGDLATRFEAEGHRATIVGENVARARTLALAHRSLHASPSHRLNLLNAQYTHMGVAVVRDESGRVYVCEVFSSPLS